MKPRIGAGWWRAEPGCTVPPGAGTARRQPSPRQNGGYRVSTDDHGQLKAVSRLMQGTLGVGFISFAGVRGYLKMKSQTELCIVDDTCKRERKAALEQPRPLILLSLPFLPNTSFFMGHVCEYRLGRHVLAGEERFGPGLSPGWCDFRLLTEMSQGHFGDYVQMYP